jgi:hypothetical protein
MYAAIYAAFSIHFRRSNQTTEDLQNNTAGSAASKTNIT